ncbi:MAG: HAD hydrolase-like protein [Bacilli bacterium]
MLKRFIPTYHAKTIYEIDFNFFLTLGIKLIISDLDNTLDAFDTYTPSAEALEFARKCEENNIKLAIISNNHSERVYNYAKGMHVDFISSAMKPFSHKVLKYIYACKINLEHVIMIGDQTVTDVACGNSAKVMTVLTDKYVERDQPTTKFNRILDKRIRKLLEKKKLLKDWRKYYE